MKQVLHTTLGTYTHKMHMSNIGGCLEMRNVRNKRSGAAGREVPQSVNLCEFQEHLEPSEDNVVVQK